ncbi:hypothetical protein [Myroides odoratus]|uniref:hypothetical protein n=1 Tax=Myroides odoratus TaxID=256 RepID=UPI0039AEF281
MSVDNVGIQDFIDNYQAADRDWLVLKWNEKFGAKFKDENYIFRQQIASIVCNQIHTAPIELIRDLFIELGKVAQVSFSVFNNYHLLAQELLERGGKEYLYDYVCAAHISFDTFLSTANIQLSPERANEILAHFDFLKETELNPQVQKMLTDHIRSRFVLRE